MKIYHLTPVQAPRMTQRDRWTDVKKGKGRKIVLQFFAFRDEVKRLNIQIPKMGAHIIFVMPMPPSWTKKKKRDHLHMPHEAKPDKDNLEKGLLDSIFKDDQAISDARVTKVWGRKGAIIIRDCGRPHAKVAAKRRATLNKLFGESI